MKKLKKPFLVHIIWRDCSSIDGWILPPDAQESGCPLIFTVGFLVGKTDEFLTVAGSWEEQFGKINGTFNIPLGQIVKVEFMDVIISKNRLKSISKF